MAVEPKRWFALGTISASFLWFFGLALLAAWLAPRLRTAKAQRIINIVVGAVMWFHCVSAGKRGRRPYPGVAQLSVVRWTFLLYALSLLACVP